jgi:hypothetical protein
MLKRIELVFVVFCLLQCFVGVLFAQADAESVWKWNYDATPSFREPVKLKATLTQQIPNNMNASLYFYVTDNTNDRPGNSTDSVITGGTNNGSTTREPNATNLNAMYGNTVGRTYVTFTTPAHAGDGHSNKTPETDLTSKLITKNEVNDKNNEPTKINSQNRLTGTVAIYPQQIRMHDLIYTTLTIKNETTETLLGVKSISNRNRTFFSLSTDKNISYCWSYNGALNMSMPLKMAILPNESFVSVRIFLEFPEMLTWDDGKKWYTQPEEKNAEFITQCVGTGVTCKLRISSLNGFYSSPPLLINSRSEKEMAAIKKWHSQFSNFLSETYYVDPKWNEEDKKWKKIPTVKDYQQFESQLSDGTLKNYIKFRRLLAAIPIDNTPALPPLEPTKPFQELGDYLDTLHPLERDCLIALAMYYFSNEDLQLRNDYKMQYLLIPKLPKSERQRYVASIHNEYRNILLNSPEPDNKTDQNLSSPLATITSPASVSPTSVSPSPTSEQQIDLTDSSKTQLENNSSWRFLAVVIVGILLVVVIAGIIFVRKISHK